MQPTQKAMRLISGVIVHLGHSAKCPVLKPGLNYIRKDSDFRNAENKIDSSTKTSSKGRKGRPNNCRNFI